MRPLLVSRARFMFHRNTQTLIEMWRGQRGGQRLPDRAGLSPIDLGALLPQVFMLGRDDEREVFRLSGTLIADLHGGDLRGTAFADLFQGADKGLALQALARARAAASPAVLTVNAHGAEGRSVSAELTLAPLTGPSGAADRTLGLYQPISALARLAGGPVQGLSLRHIIIAPDAPTTGAPRLRLVARDGLRVA